MITPPIDPILENGRPCGRQLSYRALAAPFIAVAALLLAGFVSFIPFVARHELLAYLTIVVSNLASIAFGVHAILRIRRSGGQLVGTFLAGFAICMSTCSGLLCPGTADGLLRSRHLAISAQTSAHMSKIINACQAYAARNGDHYPPHLAVLLTTGAIKPDQLLDGNATTELRPFPASRLVSPADWRTIAADVDAHCDFAYVGADSSNSASFDLIVLYTKAGCIHKHMNVDEKWDGQGRLVGYADSHVDLVVDADLPAAFAATNEVRATKGLPPLPLDSAAASRP